MFRRLRLEPAYKAVSAEIERSILAGDIKPGMPLPTEHVLAERFGVHRSTVREAIRQVEQEGLLQRREGRRLFVVLPGLSTWRHARRACSCSCFSRPPSRRSGKWP